MSLPDFGQIRRRLEQLGGVCLEVTYYALSLGSQDAETGQYAQGFAPSTIDMVLVQHEPTFVVLPSGVDSQNVATGYTDTQVFEGDRVEDANGLDYVVNTVTEHAVGDQTIFYECELALLFPYTQSDVVYPWPAPPTTGGMTLNVGAKLFDPMTIICTLTDMVQTAYDNQPQSTLSISTTDRQSTPQNNESNTLSISTQLNTTVV